MALGLILILLGLVFGFYNQTVENRRMGLASNYEEQLARALLKQIGEEIRSCAGFTPGFGPGIIGGQYELTMQTLAIPSRELFRVRDVTDAPLPGQHDVKQVKYFVAWDKDIVDPVSGLPLALGLVRQELKTLNQAIIMVDEAAPVETDQPQPTEDAQQSFRLQLYAPEIKYLEFRYFDGSQWYKDWMITQGNPLPQMVRVTIGYQTQQQEDMDNVGFNEKDFQLKEEFEVFPPRSYTAYVRVVQADTFYGSRMTRMAVDQMEQGGI